MDGDSASGAFPSQTSEIQHDTGENILQLLDTQEWLKNEIVGYQTMLISAGAAVPPEATDAENLMEKKGALQKTLQQQATDVNLKQLVLQRLQIGQTLMSCAFSDPDGERHNVGGGHGDQGGAHEGQERCILDLLKKQTKVVSDILKQHKENQSLLAAVQALRNETLDLKEANRELMHHVQRRKEEKQAESSDLEKNTQLSEANAILNKELDRQELLRHSFQGLILGSGINWAQDPAMKDLVLSLGKAAY